MITAKDIESVGIYPIYVFGKDYCDKLYIKNETAVRVRYNTTKNTCTCMSFIKGYYCKHLKMRSGDCSWLNGDYKANAIEVARMLLEHLNLSDGVLFDEYTIPSLVFCISFGVNLEENIGRIVVIYKNKLGVNFERLPIGQE